LLFDGHEDDSDDPDSEEEFDPRIPITPVLREVGWKFNEFRQIVASNRVFFNPPAGGGAGALAVQERKKAKKAKRKTKKEKKRRLQSLEVASDAGEGASNCLHTRSLSLEAPVTK
jgi:hypothetical protein